MAEFAPAAIQRLFTELQAKLPKSFKPKLSGIIGDKDHTYGYHRGRNYVSRNDYSATLSWDKKGNGDAACALDISLSPEGMHEVTRRLANAAAKNDPRLSGLREFYGTLTGARVDGRIHDAPTGKFRNVTSDDSHLWHVHLSFFRQWAEDWDTLAKIRDVILGIEDADDMPTAQELLKADIVPNRPWKEDKDSNPTVKWEYAVTRTMDDAHYARVAAEATRAESKARDEALLSALGGLAKGQDTKAIVAAITALTSAQGSAAAKLAELASAIEDMKSGGATADAIVDALAARLAN